MKTSRRSFLKAASALSGGLVVSGLHPVSARGLYPGDLTSRTLWAMGMPVRYSVPTGAEGTIAESFDAIARVDQNLSIYKSESAVSQLNRGMRVADSDLFTVCQAAIEYGEITDGYLDITVLPVLRDLGFRPTFGNRSSRNNVSSSAHVDFRKVRVNAGSTVVTHGAQIDLGGIAKGYAIDEAGVALRDRGVNNALVEAGGDILALGTKPDGSYWSIGIRDPRNPDQLFASVRVENSAIATSGGYFDNRFGQWQ